MKNVKFNIILFKRVLELIVCDILLAGSFLYFPEKIPWISKLTSIAAMFFIHILYIPEWKTSKHFKDEHMKRGSLQKKSPAERPLTKFLYVLICILAAVSIGSAILIS